MCLGIPGQITEIVDPEGYLAQIDVNGVRRVISVRLLEGDLPTTGDWVLVHVGFAMARIDEAEALLTLEALRQLGDAYVAEVDGFDSTSIV